MYTCVVIISIFCEPQLQVRRATLGLCIYVYIHYVNLDILRATIASLPRHPRKIYTFIYIHIYHVNSDILREQISHVCRHRPRKMLTASG